MIDLTAIEARLAAATPGPWRRCAANEGKCQCNLVWSVPVDAVVAHPMAENGAGEGGDFSDAENRANMDLIAHAPTDLAALVAEVRRLEARLEKAEACAVLLARCDDDEYCLCGMPEGQRRVREWREVCK